MPRHSLSNSHFSTDYQSHDVLQWLKDNAPKQYEKLNKDFEGDLDRIKFTGSHYDTEAMEVDIEWGSWLVDAIEQLDIKEYEHDDGSKGWSIFWEEGEPWLVRNFEDYEIRDVVVNRFMDEYIRKNDLLLDQDEVFSLTTSYLIDFMGEHFPTEDPEALIDFMNLIEAGFYIGYEKAALDNNGL